MKSLGSITSQIAAVTTLAVAWLVTPLPVFAQSYQTIDPPGSTYTIARSINDNGQIVGSYQDSNHAGHGFLYNNGIYTSLSGAATDINSLGQIVGTSIGGFLYSHGTYTSINPPGRHQRGPIH
jgi:probable HAF family extracellular repeat protein